MSIVALESHVSILVFFNDESYIWSAWDNDAYLWSSLLLGMFRFRVGVRWASLTDCAIDCALDC